MKHLRVLAMVVSGLRSAAICRGEPSTVITRIMSSAREAGGSGRVILKR